MTRIVLSASLVVLWVAAGLAASFQQSENLASGRRLADLQRRCEMVEAAVSEMEARVLAHVPGVDDTRRNEFPVDGSVDASSLSQGYPGVSE